MTLLQRADAMSRAVPRGEIHDAWPRPSSSQVEAEGLSAKRIFDIIGTLFALLLFGPLMFAIWAALALSGGSPIFCQQRVGRHGQPFRCYKFRTMVKDANKILTLYLDANPEARAEWDRSFKLASDPRITWFGTFLRRTSMDELPQLFNVLKGEMSLVGPRPIIPSEVERYAGNIGAYYSCRPGITGLWQVSGRNLVSYERRVQLDTLYARSHSLWLDLTILIRTVRVVVSGIGAS